MFRKFLAKLGIDSKAAARHAPYAAPAANAIYNLLFCDSVDAFLAKPGERAAPWQVALAADPPIVAVLRRLAEDPKQEGRVRYLACQRLRDAGQSVPAKQLLGVIFEVPLAGGLDTLAAYAEGGVRYVNQSGKIAVCEGLAELAPLVEALFAASQPLVQLLGPWADARRPPPARGQIRMTFLVSDGLYFGEGPMAVMQQQPLAAPVIQAATTLLQKVVDLGTQPG